MGSIISLNNSFFDNIAVDHRDHACNLLDAFISCDVLLIGRNREKEEDADNTQKAVFNQGCWAR